jgi:hypothetical protein
MWLCDRINRRIADRQHRQIRLDLVWFVTLGATPAQ